MINVTEFKREEDFKKWFLAEPDPVEQLKGLKAWRQHQQRIVESLPNLVRLLASEQYTHSDHFLLELLQNADDNDYPFGSTPSLRITLDGTSCTFECNEVGFTAENVFAICYAAATTKKRRLTGRTFIGEKGIGFKSIFAVAQSVQIHSGDYHFELRDQEFVIPHLLAGTTQPGSRIVVRFKREFKDLPAEVSKRLRLLSEHSRHFLIFLQQLEKLTVRDQIQNAERTVQVVRDKELQRCVVKSVGPSVEYLVRAFPVEIPTQIVKSRFEELNAPLTREIVFAVPLPADLERQRDPAGRLFCYLPTQQKTGMPIHIQLDAKTVTNREDITDARTNPWNHFMLQKTGDMLQLLFEALRDLPEFSGHLPKYLPPNPGSLGTSNRDLAQCVGEFCERMKEAEWVLDRHGDFRPPAYIRFCDPPLDRWITNDQYEAHLIPIGVTTRDQGGADATFLSAGWNSFKEVLVNYGCQTLSSSEIATLWSKGGVPKSIRGGDDEEKRQFLGSILKYCEREPGANWKTCPIFPLRSNEKSYWGTLHEKVLLVVSDIQNVTISEGLSIVDPIFTISPSGSGRHNEKIRDFNNAFRDFLTGKLAIKRYSESSYLEEIVIRDMQKETELLSRKDLLEWSQKWVELYYRIWRRQKTLQDESASQWTALIQGIRKCHIPVKRKPPNQAQTTAIVSSAILPARLGGVAHLDVAYCSVGAAVIDVLIEEATEAYWKGQKRRRESAIELNDWGEFLRSVGASPGPSLSTRRFEPAIPLHCPGGELFVEDLKEGILGSEGAGFRFESIETVVLDAPTASLLFRKDLPEQLTRALAPIWPQINSGKTIVRYSFGSRASAAKKVFPVSLASSQITGRPFKVLSRDNDEVRADDCFLDLPENIVFASGVLPLVQSERYAQNRDYLTAIGVKGAITVESVEAAIRDAFSGGRILHDPAKFAPFLKLVARVANRNKQDRIWLMSCRIFLDPQKDELVDFKTWKTRACAELFDSETRELLNLSFGDEMESSSPEELISLLESIQDLGTSGDQINTWFLRVARALYREDGPSVVGLFTDLVAKGKLLCMGEKVTEISRLPLLWDKVPLPESTVGVLLPPERPDEAAAVLEAVSRLGWPVLSKRSVAVRPSPCVELADKDWRLLNRVLAELRKLFEKSDPVVARRLAAMPFALTLASLKASLRPTKEVTLTVEGVESVFNVPYWRNETGFHIATANKDTISAIGEIIDSECHVTVAPFIELIQERVEPEVLEYSGDDDGSDNTSPSVGGSDKQGNEATKEDSSAEDTLLGFNQNGDDANSPGDNEKTAERSIPDGEVRKRLCSFVISSGTKKGGATGTKQSDEGVDQNEETEQEGAKVLKEFFKKRGLDALSVEDQNCGYDFKVSIGARTLCIELKTSRAKWRGWEHSLTPNEFKTALEKKDDYFLCVVDRAFESSREIYFIQNPAEKITDYLFDAPWKNVSSNMSNMISAFKATEGVLDQ